jgi:hypothetical protein
MSPRVGSVFAERTPHPALRATFSHKGKEEAPSHTHSSSTPRRQWWARCALPTYDPALCDLLCDCPTGKSLKPVQPGCEKYSASRSTQITPKTPPSRAHKRGVSRSSRTLGAGSGGRGAPGAQAGFRRVSLLMSEGRAPTNGEVTDGKAVWFWHRWLVSSRRRFCEIQPGFEGPSIRRRWRQEEFVSRESTV